MRSTGMCAGGLLAVLVLVVGCGNPTDNTKDTEQLRAQIREALERSAKAEARLKELEKQPAPAPKAAELSPETQRLIDASIAQAKQGLANSTRPQAIVAIYLDTEDPDDVVPERGVEYMCFQGGGYSGVDYVPLRQPWTRRESVSAERGGDRRIQLDPGPPYEVVNRSVVLVQGEATDLGRIVLKKVKAEGTASIFGVVKDAAGNPLSDVQVTGGGKSTRTDARGEYVLDGFGLEKVSLKAAKDGCFGGEAEIAIRNMENRRINQDLTLFRPCKLRLKFVVSGK